MTLLAICQWIQETAFSTAVRESTWGFPILGAVHVLAMAWFAGTLLTGDPGGANLRRWRTAGIVLMVLTGALLFWIEPVKCYQSVSFRLKLALLVAALVSMRTRLPVLSLLLWAAVIFAARGIAFF